MTDRHDNPLAVGARVTVLKGGSGLVGKVGTVLAMLPSCGAVRMKPGVQVADGDWSVWCEPGDVELVEGKDEQ